MIRFKIGDIVTLMADFKKAIMKKGHSEASANCELDRFNHLFSAWSSELAEGK